VQGTLCIAGRRSIAMQCIGILGINKRGGG
jgi:hypothetical protein